MPWLLDTHVWVWSQLEPERLGFSTTGILQDSTEVLYVATVSSLEIARLVSWGHLELCVGVAEWLDAALCEISGVTIELTHSIALAAYALPGAFHRDPADRILVATARTHDLVLITADQRILDYPHVRSHDSGS